jgi:hypothetical protein
VKTVQAVVSMPHVRTQKGASNVTVTVVTLETDSFVQVHIKDGVNFVKSSDY